MSLHALDVLHHEHRIIAKLLDLLERQVSLIGEDREADGDIVKEIVEYFRTFPDVYHHPKEDLIVRAVNRRDPEAGQALAGLGGEHEEQAVELARLSRALVEMLMEPATRSAAFARRATEFIADQRRHMAWEDANFFDIAAATLTAADWKAVDERIAKLNMPRPETHDRFERIDRELSGWRAQARL